MKNLTSAVTGRHHVEVINQKTGEREGQLAVNWNECRFEPDKFTPTSINHAEKRVTRDRTMSDDASIKKRGKK